MDEQVRGVAQRWAEAELRGDAAALVRILADDFPSRAVVPGIKIPG